MLKSKAAASLFAVLFLGLAVTGCSKSYQASSIQQSLLDICRKEYGIENIQVKTADDTIGVYLPFGNLFGNGLRDALKSGRVENIDKFFQPSAEAIEKIEDLLFALSRVMMSADKNFRFYVLQVTDVENSGLQLVIKGYLDDIKRVRIWDISRTEYRMRIVHELHLNQAVLWHKPVRAFYRDLETQTLENVKTKYFKQSLTTQALSHLFFDAVPAGQAQAQAGVNWKIEDIRSIDLDKSGAVVYTKVRPALKSGALLGDADLEFLFIITLGKGEEPRIARVIPFQYRDEQGHWSKISFPSELQLDKNLAEWKEEFPMAPIHLGTFLGEQLTRRMQAIYAVDERIQNTFYAIKAEFDFTENTKPGVFSMNIQSQLRDPNAEQGGAVLNHEDMLYALNLAFREFVNLVRNYSFGDFDRLSLNVAEAGVPWILKRDQLELFRRKQVDMAGLLAFTKI